MMPASQQRASRRNPAREAISASLGVLSLAVLFLPSRDALTHATTIEWRPAAELAASVFLVAMAALAAPRVFAPARPGTGSQSPDRHGGGAQSDRRGDPAVARARAQPLLGFEALAVPSRARPRVGGPLAARSRGGDRVCRAIVVVRRGLFDLPSRAARPHRSAHCHRSSGRARRRLGCHGVRACRAPAARHRVRRRACPPRRGTRTRLADAGRRRGAASGRARRAGAAAQQSCRIEAAGCLSRLYRILRHDSVRHAEVPRRFAGRAHAVRGGAARIRVSGRLEPAGFADFWRRIMACSCDARQRDPPR